MSNVAHVFPAAVPSNVEPMPETKTRRTIKNTKRRIAWLTKQIRAEEKRIALRDTARTLEARLDDLRRDGADF